MEFTLKKISVRKNGVIARGRLSKFRNWKLQVDKSFAESGYISFSICCFKRLFADLVCACEFNLEKFLWATFVVTDTRIWDSHTDKPITWEEYEKLPERREGKPKFKFRKAGKEKWYYSSKFLKLYNLDFLNDPFGITVELIWFSFFLFTSLQLGHHPRHNFCLSFDICKTSVGFVGEIEICLFGLFAILKVQKNKNAIFTQIIGNDEIFKYYTMEDEKEYDEPHIHVCVDLDNPKWVGERFENFQPLKTVATVILLPKGSLYTCENVNIDAIYDSKIYHYKQQICDWLNALDSDLGKSTNAQHAIRNYLLSNPNCYYRL